MEIDDILKEAKDNNPYPDDIFTEPHDWKKISDWLRKGEFSPDSIFGSWGRRVWNACIVHIQTLIDMQSRERDASSFSDKTEGEE